MAALSAPPDLTDAALLTRSGELSVTGDPRAVLGAVSRAVLDVTGEEQLAVRVALAAYTRLADAGLVVRQVDRG